MQTQGEENMQTPQRKGQPTEYKPKPVYILWARLQVGTLSVTDHSAQALNLSRLKCSGESASAHTVQKNITQRFLFKILAGLQQMKLFMSICDQQLRSETALVKLAPNPIKVH